MWKAASVWEEQLSLNVSYPNFRESSKLELNCRIQALLLGSRVALWSKWRHISVLEVFFVCVTKPSILQPSSKSNPSFPAFHQLSVSFLLSVLCLLSQPLSLSNLALSWTHWILPLSRESPRWEPLSGLHLSIPTSLVQPLNLGGPSLFLSVFRLE